MKKKKKRDTSTPTVADATHKLYMTHFYFLAMMMMT